MNCVSSKRPIFITRKQRQTMAAKRVFLWAVFLAAVLMIGVMA